jgi:ABC-type transport system involved in cytochrome bd biosynthesis fused ATPase/permease subunit
MYSFTVAGLSSSVLPISMLVSLVVAHRLSTVQHADHVIVMEAGSVADTGTHHELLGRSTQYRDLVESQQRPLATEPAVPA